MLLAQLLKSKIDEQSPTSQRSKDDVIKLICHPEFLRHIVVCALANSDCKGMVAGLLEMTFQLDAEMLMNGKIDGNSLDFILLISRTIIWRWDRHYSSLKSGYNVSHA